MRNQYPLMARFNQWVNQQLYRHVELLDEKHYRESKGLFFGSIHNTLNHLLLVDELWMSRIIGKDLETIKSLDQILYSEFSALRDARLDVDTRLIRLIDRLSEQQLEQMVSFSYLDQSGEGCLSVELILMTLFNHQTHHRGQINAVLTQNYMIPPDMDLIDFVDSTT